MKRLSLALLIVFAMPASAQELATAFKSTEVAPGIHLVEGADGFGGGNIALLVGKQYVVLVDDGLEPIAKILQEYVQGLAGRPINFVVNTHVHGDHAGGNAYFAENDTVVVAHENIRRRLLEDADPAGGPAGLPVLTFEDGVNFYLDGIEARIFHLPHAHTDGDAGILFPGLNVLQAGDTYFNGLFPFIDLDNGGSVDGYISAQRRLLEMASPDTKIIPGHGPLASRADLEKDLATLIEARALVEAMVEDGKTEDQIVAANPLAKFHDDYNWGFITTERMTRTLYRDLTNGK